MDVRPVPLSARHTTELPFGLVTPVAPLTLAGAAVVSQASRIDHI